MKRRLSRTSILSLAILLIFLALQADSVKAEEPPVFTLDQAIAKGLTNNPGFKAEKVGLDIGQLQVAKAAGLLRPSLIVGGLQTLSISRFGLSVPLELGQRRKSKINIARTQTEITAIQIKTNILELKNNIRQAYTRVYSGQEKIKYYQEISDTTQDLLKIAQKRKNTSDLDVILAQTLLLNINNDMETAKYDLSKAKNALGLMLGEPLPEKLSFLVPNQLPQSVISAVGQDFASLEQISPENLVAIAIEKRPELQESYKNLELIELEKTRLKATRIPIITLATGLDVDNGVNPKLLKIFFAADIPIPNSREIKINIEEAEARGKQLKLEQQALKDKIAFEVNSAYLNFISTRKRVTCYETELLPKLQEVVHKSIDSFAAGKSSVIIPIDVEQSFIRNSFAYLQSLSDYQNTIGDLERSLGVGL